MKIKANNLMIGDFIEVAFRNGDTINSEINII